ncbi:putative membrane protein [Fermentimonas caenicola]|jgi:hypothetical protein|uniref:Putative membrane protein n=1 Tax=Fermentimonas caenicola TaxID=1562970 RepID=A0A098C000_9BACT|nr:putative membrane protein [Fermentimonas caenicola]
MKLFFTFLLAVIAVLLFLALVIPRARWQFLYLVESSYMDLWEIARDYIPSKQRKVSVWLFMFMLLLMIPVAIFVGALMLVCVPAISLFRAFKYPNKIDEMREFDQDVNTPTPSKPKKTLEEIEAERKAFIEKIMMTRFDVPRKDISFEPDEHEIIFYTPSPAPELEKLIDDNLEDIRGIFGARHYGFFFLPDFNRNFSIEEGADQLDYFNPRKGERISRPAELLTYSDIQTALCIPDKVDAPCFIRCKRANEDPVIFSFVKIEIPEGENIISAVKEYFRNVGDGRLYHLASDDEIRASLEGLSADERFDDDVYLIGKEIRERIEQLRAKGLSSLAIKKLIGDDSDKPGKLLIDRHNKLILTDYGNKEIKLSPIHKAVFFLFLRHPEGIYFKDLGNYRDELSKIYNEITGRDDVAAIEESINKLTDPFDNSINEKCARIKNAFVSEFREEVAQWYFIDGNRGDKKTIKLPRELVTWEIKD